MRDVAPALRFCLRATTLAVVALLACCASEHFSGSNGRRAGGSDDATVAVPVPSPTATPTPPTSCVSGDKVVVAWSGAAKECIVGQSATFDFAHQTCTHLHAASFACDWASVVSQLALRGLASPALATASSDGSKLVACGQSDDGNRIVVQWLKAPPPATSLCAFDPATMAVVTGCYQVLVNGEPLPTPASPEEQDAIVYACMNSL